MAVTATLSVDQSSIVSGQRVNFVVAVANSGSDAVTVTGIAATVSPLGSASTDGEVQFTPSTPTQIGGSATVYYTFDDTFWAQPLLPPVVSATGSEESAFGVTVVVSIGTATTAVSNTVTVQVSPATQTFSGVSFAPWLYGELRFEFLQASGLYPPILV